MPHNSHFHRLHLILNAIYHLGPISRTELINLTDYRPASVGAIINELLESQLIAETGYASAGHGRKRILLEINKDHICAIGVSITTKTALCLAAGIDGRIFAQSELPTDQTLPKDILASRISGQITELLKSCAGKQIVGIGICRPLYDPLTYQSTSSLLSNYTHFHDWIHHSLKPMLENLTTVPVETFSPVTLPVLAEQRFGVAKGVQNFLCVELSNGIGASLFCNGAPVEGAHGVAGELGHTVIDRSGNRLCYCGKPGCVESMTAYPALSAQISGALKSGVFSALSPFKDSQNFSIQDIRKALDFGDRMCMHYVKESAVHLGIAIANAVNLLNPELIVLHGFMLELGEYFLHHLETSIRENTIAIAGNFDIRISSSMETILPLGAAAELFTAFLKMDNYKWVYQLQPCELSDKTDEFKEDIL